MRLIRRAMRRLYAFVAILTGPSWATGYIPKKNLLNWEDKRVSVMSNDGKGAYTIREVPDTEATDAMSSAPWRRTVASSAAFTAIINLLLTLWNARLQGRFLREARIETESWNWKYNLSTLAVRFEVVTMLASLIPCVATLNLGFGKHRKRLRLVGEHVPDIDVIIATCNEEEGIVQDTVLAALALDYPQEKLRILIADDGGSDSIRTWVLTLQRPNVYYTHRTTREGFKAGNLNHAVEYLDSLPGGSRQFIASLDADMIVEKHWLRSVAAHIVLDRKLALVCPTQLFYNVPIDDPLCQTNIVAWTSGEPIRDAANIAWNTGSGFILRRDALDDIGGFATDCIIEDVRSSLDMLAKGWKTAYVSEALQYGLIPPSYHGHIKQYVRWDIGGCQVGLNFCFYFWKRWTGELTPMQRILSFSYGATAMVDPIIGVVHQLLTPLRLASGTPMAFFNNHSQFTLLLRIQCATVLVGWLQLLQMAALVGFQAAVQPKSFSTWLAPYNAISIVRTFFLPYWLGGKPPGFTPTGSLKDVLHERSNLMRASLTRRIRGILLHCGAWYHTLLALVIAFAALFRARAVLHAHGNKEWDGSLGLELARYILWPTLTWVFQLVALLIPLQYAISPPSMPAREELLGAREESGARYPILSQRRIQRSRYGTAYTKLDSAVVVACACVLAATWYIREYE